ncbi:unnamed protein product [Meloidogyne enterolobii]|uniref:Uncharacterized protein n=1 Tax=Meloidogyne enterolobii TaxID=390850 RepID=A0ACB0ZMI9_MELEN
MTLSCPYSKKGYINKDFVAQKKFALDLISILPEQDFNNRLSISLIIFNKKAILQFPFVIGRKQNDILKEIESIEHTGGPTSLVAASETVWEIFFKFYFKKL